MTAGRHVWTSEAEQKLAKGVELHQRNWRVRLAPQAAATGPQHTSVICTLSSADRPYEQAAQEMAAAGLSCMSRVSSTAAKPSHAVHAGN